MARATACRPADADRAGPRSRAPTTNVRSMSSCCSLADAHIQIAATVLLRRSGTQSIRPLHTAQLGQRDRAARQRLERSHLQIVWLLGQGRSEREVAAISGYGQRWIGVIVHRYNEQGPDGLGDHRGKNAGAKPLLDKEGEAVLKTVLAEPPADGGLWTGPKVAAWMSARLGRKVWPQRGWDYLKKLGHRMQMPRPRHAKAASAEEQALYKKACRADG